MRIRTALGITAGTALLLGASIAFAQQETTQTPPAHPYQQSSEIANCYGAHAGMSGMRGNSMMTGMMNGYGMMGERMNWRSGMHATLQRLLVTLETAKATTDPAKLKTLLDEAQQEASQLMNHMGMMSGMSSPSTQQNGRR